MHTNIFCLAGVWSCLLLQQSAYFSLQFILSVLYLYISDTEVGALSTEHSWPQSDQLRLRKSTFFITLLDPKLMKVKLTGSVYRDIDLWF